jgi:hypothetical protein
MHRWKSQNKDLKSRSEEILHHEKDRMEENRIPKRVISMKLEATRPRGRPRNRWQDE